MHEGRVVDAAAGALCAPRASSEWTHSSGIVLPRGAVVTSAASLEDFQRIAQGSERRGVRAGDRLSRKVKRSAAEAAQLEGFCQWLGSEGLDLFGSVSYSEDYATRHRIYSLGRALDDVWRGLTDMPIHGGRHTGFRGKFVLTGEWHPSGRNVPHVHLALESGGAPQQAVCDDLWRYFFRTRGRSRFEPMRDVETATLYALKDSVKASVRDADSVRFRLWHPKRVK